MKQLSKQERLDRINKSIQLIGWGQTIELIKDKEDRAIIKQIYEEKNKSRLSDNANILKQHGIEF
jgi:hypothetical protein